jgi:hypothetical protein
LEALEDKDETARKGLKVEGIGAQERRKHEVSYTMCWKWMEKGGEL